MQIQYVLTKEEYDHLVESHRKFQSIKTLIDGSEFHDPLENTVSNVIRLLEVVFDQHKRIKEVTV
jgi:hypothetical protein